MKNTMNGWNSRSAAESSGGKAFDALFAGERRPALSDGGAKDPGAVSGEFDRDLGGALRQVGVERDRVERDGMVHIISGDNVMGTSEYAFVPIRPGTRISYVFTGAGLAAGFGVSGGAGVATYEGADGYRYQIPIATAGLEVGAAANAGVSGGSADSFSGLFGNSVVGNAFAKLGPLNIGGSAGRTVSREGGESRSGGFNAGAGAGLSGTSAYTWPTGPARRVGRVALWKTGRPVTTCGGTGQRLGHARPRARWVLLASTKP